MIGHRKNFPWSAIIPRRFYALKQTESK